MVPHICYSPNSLTFNPSSPHNAMSPPKVCFQLVHWKGWAFRPVALHTDQNLYNGIVFLSLGAGVPWGARQKPTWQGDAHVVVLIGMCQYFIPRAAGLKSCLSSTFI